MTLATPQIGQPPSQSDSKAVSEPAWEIAKIFPNQGHWSKWDYLVLPTNRLVELSKGRVEVLEMATDFHQAIVAFLFEALLLFVRSSKLGTVRFSPLPMAVDPDTFREPDVLFMKAENDFRRHNEYWEAADLVMEVVSSDRARDLELKRNEYAKAKIPEYWIVDPALKEISVLKLVGDRYELAGIHHSGNQATSVLLVGFGVDVASVFEAK